MLCSALILPLALANPGRESAGICYVASFAGLQFCTGVLFLYLTYRLYYLKMTQTLLLVILIAGALCRVFFFFSPPIFEDDYHRYLWDGAVVASGTNPYRFSPEEVQNRRRPDGLPDDLRALKTQATDVLPHINSQDLRTIYPPVTQVLFAGAHFLLPWSPFGLRVLYLLFDLSALFLLVLLLRTLDLPRYVLWLYWGNPLIFFEVYNSLHMEIFLLPILFLFLYSLYRNSIWGASGSLALAVGLKIWPVLLLPFVIYHFWPSWRSLIGPVFLFIALTALLFVPMFNVSWSKDAGWIAYSHVWRNNAGAFSVIFTGTQVITRNSEGHKSIRFLPGNEAPNDSISWLEVFRYNEVDPRILSRGIVVVLMIVVTIFLLGRPIRGSPDTAMKMGWTTFWLFLLIPTPFPWYALWVLPFFSLRPVRAYLVVIPLLSIYELQYYFMNTGSRSLFEETVVWAEWIPVFLVLLLVYWRKKTTVNSAKRSGPPNKESPVY